MVRLLLIVWSFLLARSEDCPNCQEDTSSLLQHGIKEQVDTSDPAWCSEHREMPCDVFWNPFSKDSEKTKCPDGAACMKGGNGMINQCKCMMGVCKNDGLKAMCTVEAAPAPAASPAAAPAAPAPQSSPFERVVQGGQPATNADPSHCLNRREMPCKVGWMPFLDSSKTACGVGQMCAQVAGGPNRCVCQFGTCDSAGSCR
mmetsp:Transcript_105780/g.252314  ORF Transcript_105780/g.252314 Transcript_105780/m.252314 type:complete len:201 (-) Transcript_105780:129-731(-)